MMNIPVFLSADNNYAPFVATTMASILDNTNSYIDFYILDSGITEENQEKIKELKNKFDNFSVEFLKVDLDEHFNDFKETKNITKAMYSRFLIPYLKPALKKALYTDADVIFLDDIKKMYDEPLEDYAIGAVFEKFAQGKINDTKKKRTNISNEHKYFSSGNLIIDCQKWRENNIFQKLIKINNEYKNQLVEPDMDILNKFFDSDYKILPLKYCWINQNYKFYEMPAEQIVVRHFNGDIKPWHIHPNVQERLEYPCTIDKNKFWKYAALTDFYDILIEGVKFKTIMEIQKYITFAVLREKRNADN